MGANEGGDSWMGLTSNDRELRINRMRVAIANRPPATEEQRARMSTARKLFMSDPSHRKMTSETTKRAMYRPEVQAKLHKTKTLSKEQREAYSVQGRINGK